MWPFQQPSPPDHTQELDELRRRITELEQRPAAEQVAAEDFDLLMEPVVELLAEFQGELQEMQEALEHGLKTAERRERRIRSAVTRGINRLEESGEIDPNLEATIAEVLDDYAVRSREEELPPVHPRLGDRQGPPEPVYEPRTLGRGL